MSFKVGDRVTISCDSGSCRAVSNSAVDTITRIDCEEWASTTNRSERHRLRELRLVKEPKDTKHDFKVGDTVQILEGHSNAGCTTKIIGIYDGWAEVEGGLREPNHKAPDFQYLCLLRRDTDDTLPPLKMALDCWNAIPAGYTRATANASLAGLVDAYPSTTNKDKEKTIMTKTVERFKQLTLSGDDKLLRKYNLQDSNGDWTDEAEDIAIAMLLGDKKADLVAKAKQLEAEDKAAKK